jgi:hypothetical protein
VVADLWALSGPAGLLLSAVIMFALAWSLSGEILARAANGLTLFVALVAVWDLAFGPLYSNLRDVMLAMGLVLMLKAERPPHRGPRAERLASK